MGFSPHLPFSTFFENRFYLMNRFLHGNHHQHTYHHQKEPHQNQITPTNAVHRIGKQRRRNCRRYITHKIQISRSARHQTRIAQTRAIPTPKHCRGALPRENSNKHKHHIQNGIRKQKSTELVRFHSVARCATETCQD